MFRHDRIDQLVVDVDLVGGQQRGADPPAPRREMPESAYKTFEIAQGGLLERVGTIGIALDAATNARQQFPPTYNANGYVDVLSTAFTRKARLIHCNRVLAYVAPPVIEVDTEEDFAHLEFQLALTPEIVQTRF